MHHTPPLLLLQTGQQLSRFISTSPKQYLITKRIDDLLLPCSTDTLPDCMLLSRAKGLQKRRHDCLSTQAFMDTINTSESTRIDVYNFRRFYFNVFLTKTRRRILSKGCTKRVFLPHMMTDDSHFSLPIFIKKLAEETV